jgi:hypothetical protein
MIIFTFSVWKVSRKSQVMVFDRWGKKVLDDADYKNNWNGADLADGVYYYILKRSDGKSYEGNVHKIGSK